MDKKVYYLGYYDINENKALNRNICLAATNKMSYIISALEKQGYSVNVISASVKQNGQAQKKETISIGKKSTLTFLNSMKKGNKIKRFLNIYYTRLQLYKYIKDNVGENDTLIVYHALAYAKMISKLKKKKKFKLVVELEEIYADVIQKEKVRKKEYDFFQLADAYIFPTELLNDKINTNNKPYSIIYGTYQIEEKKNSIFNDDKIHVAYTGTFMLDKGVLTAINSAKYLDEKYHLHILGFGKKSDTDTVIDEINKISQTSKCKLTYDGLLSGDDYISFLQSCHIGLSPQSNQATFNETSFPSKVLSYLSNGLRVVSIRIKSIECSRLNEVIYFFDENSGESLSKAIMEIDINAPYDSRKIIKSLDVKFMEDIKNLLEKLE